MEIKFSPQSNDDNYNHTTTDYQEPSDTFNSVVVDDRNNGGFSDDSYQDSYSAPQQDRYSGQYVPNQQNFNTSGQTNPQYNQPYGNQQYGNQQQYQQQPYGNQQFNQPYGNQQQYQQQPFQQTQTKFCRHCGGVIPADAVVCTKCGRQVEQISQNPNGQNVVINNINNNNGGFYTNEPVSPKNQGIALVLAACGFVGLGGLHRFYSGKIGSGLLWFFTYGFFGIGTIVDLIHIAQGKFRDSNGLPIKK